MVKSYLLLPHKAIKIALEVQFSDSKDCQSFNLLLLACSIWGLNICIALEKEWKPGIDQTWLLMRAQRQMRQPPSSTDKEKSGFFYSTY